MRADVLIFVIIAISWDIIAIVTCYIIPIRFVFNFFLLACPIGLPIFSLFSNEPELVTEIVPGMVMTPFPSSVLGRDSNSQPYDCESNSLITRPD